jgi:hypothetical protein
VGRKMSDQNLNLWKKHVQFVEQIKSILESIKWAPIITVSSKRRYEVLSAFTFIAIVLFGEAVCLFALYLLAVS